MDIAALSMNMAQLNLGQAVGISVLKMAQDNAVQQSPDFVKSMQQSIHPHLGKSIDIRV